MSQLRNQRAATKPALLPGLPVVRTGDRALDEWIGKVTEHLQVREGQRGNQWEKTVTKRDLEALGITTTSAANLASIGASLPPDGVGIRVETPSGYALVSIEQFANSIRSTALYKDLLKRLDDKMRFDKFPEQIRTILLDDIASEAAKRGADIRNLEQKIQTETESMAFTVHELTASIANAYAGVRRVEFASATAQRATAGVVTQVQARLDDFNSGGATVEESMTAIADRASGLEAQYTLKVNAGGAYAAIGVAATETAAGVGDSAIIFVADKLAFVSPSDTVGTGPGQVNPTNPDLSRIPFGVDSTGVYINGNVRINAGGSTPTLSSLAAATGIYVTTTSDFFKVDAAGAAVNSTVTLTANFTAGLAGTVTWTKSGTSTAPPAAGTSNTYTINAADQTADTCTYTATYTTGGTTYTDSVTIVRLRDGSNAVTTYLTNEAHTVPSSTSGVVSSLTGASGSMKVFKGSTDVTSSCTFAVQTNASLLTTSINASGDYSVTATGSWSNASTVATITYRATYLGQTFDKVFTITKSMAGATGSTGPTGATGPTGSTGPAGATGTRGSVTLYASGSAWSDATANAAIVSATGSSTKVVGDQVTISNGTTFVATKYWSATAWVSPGVVIDGNLLVTGTVSANAMGANSITAANAALADACITTAKIGALQVDTLQIKGNAVTQPIAAYTAGSNLGATTVQSASITTTGASVLVNCGCVLSTGAGAALVGLTLKRGTTTLWTIQITIDGTAGDGATSASTPFAAPPFKDTPAAGTYTYTLEASSSSGYAAVNRGLSLLEVKK